MEHKPPHARPSAHVVGPEEVRLILIFSAKNVEDAASGAVFLDIDI
jgi:hypothetical protein